MRTKKRMMAGALFCVMMAGIAGCGAGTGEKAAGEVVNAETRLADTGTASAGEDGADAGVESRDTDAEFEIFSDRGETTEAADAPGWDDGGREKDGAISADSSSAESSEDESRTDVSAQDGQNGASGNRADSTDAAAPSELAGDYHVDPAVTEAGLQGRTLQSLFGTGFGAYGSSLKLGADGSFSYYIGIGTGGKGTYALSEGADAKDGANIVLTADYVSDMGGERKTKEIRTERDGESLFLVTEEFGVQIYWTRDDGTSMAQAAAAAGDSELLDALPLTFTYSSGAGAWGTQLTLLPDGSFTGGYSDSDMGDNGEGYPHGTFYYCEFAGRFSEIQKESGSAYSLTLTELTKEDEPGTEKIEDGIRYVASEPAGLMGGTAFILYTPETDRSTLSEEFLSWWSRWMFEDQEALGTRLGCYGLMNAATGDGFFSYQ